MRSSNSPAFPALLLILAASFLGAARGDTGRREVLLKVEWARAENELIGEDDALGIYRPSNFEERIEDSDARFRLEIHGFTFHPSTRVSISSVDNTTGRQRDRTKPIALHRLYDGRLVTPWLVAVSSRDDKAAPNLKGRCVLVGVNDSVVAHVRKGAQRAQVSLRPVSMPVGVEHPKSVLKVPLRATVLRTVVGGPPVVGSTRRSTLELMRHQFKVLNEVLAQCHVWVGEPEHVEVKIADPPGPGMLTIGEELGLPSSGLSISMMIDGQKRGPWRIGAGNKPEEVARVLSRFIEREPEGYRVQVFVNNRNNHMSFGSADLLVWRPDGSLAELQAPKEASISNDSSLSLKLVSVKLDDGLEPYSANNIFSGTPEERMLIRCLASKRNSLEIFVINRFLDPSKQGESFVEGVQKGLGNTAILDWRALDRARQAYTLAHEVGHLLLGDLDHPDSQGDNRTWLLMHSKASSAAEGPRRITAEQCEEMRARIKVSF